ncbi:MAG: hypothetical protein AB2L07_08345 [Thermoanaerobaculaceae bacterium]
MAGFLRVDQMGATLAGVRVEWTSLRGLAVAYFLLAWLVTARRSGAPAE